MYRLKILKQLAGSKKKQLTPPTYNYTITLGERSATFDIYQAVASSGWNGTAYVNVVINCTAGTWAIGSTQSTIGSNGVGLPGIQTGLITNTFPNGGKIRINIPNTAVVIGRGGTTSYGAFGVVGPSPGGDGIDARVTANNCPVTIDSLGIISGGSGCGGYIKNTTNGNFYLGGGGVPLGGTASKTSPATGVTFGSYYGGTGGGLYAQPGQNGYENGAAYISTSGAAAGACVRGNSNVTWINTGTRYGTLIS